MTLSEQYRRSTSEAQGERLWALYGLSVPGDLVLEDIALQRGVLVIEQPLVTMEARIIRSGQRGLIRVRAGIPETGRKRFAIAHELGHWELHKGISQLFACTSDDMVARYRASPEEGEANWFAAGLLMPSHLFTAKVIGAVFSLDTLSQAARYFQTSLTATAIRYVELSDDYCAVAVADGGRIRWWRGTECFERRFWLQHGANLSRSSLAGSLFVQGHGRVGPDEVDISAWSERGATHGSGSIVEESLYMETYGQILTLLRLP